MPEGLHKREWIVHPSVARSRPAFTLLAPSRPWVALQDAAWGAIKAERWESGRRGLIRNEIECFIAKIGSQSLRSGSGFAATGDPPMPARSKQGHALD